MHSLFTAWQGAVRASLFSRPEGTYLPAIAFSSAIKVNRLTKKLSHFLVDMASHSIYIAYDETESDPAHPGQILLATDAHG